ncbi:hypothetical protein ACWGQ5_52585 [Streptomyces sp. NPDC055722]
MTTSPVGLQPSTPTAHGVPAPSRPAAEVLLPGAPDVADFEPIAPADVLLHIRTRAKSPVHNGVHERAFAVLKYEHLYRLGIEVLSTLAREDEHYRHVFNRIHPHEAPAGRPLEV